MSTRFRVGDLVWYVFPGATAATPQTWAAAVVIAVGPTRIGVRTVLGRRPRYVGAWSLTPRRMPPADVRALWSEEDARSAAR